MISVILTTEIKCIVMPLHTNSLLILKKKENSKTDIRISFLSVSLHVTVKNILFVIRWCVITAAKKLRMDGIDGSWRVKSLMWRSLAGWGHWLAFTPTPDSIVLICFPIPAIIPAQFSVIIWFTVVQRLSYVLKSELFKKAAWSKNYFTDQICFKTLKMIIYAKLNYYSKENN